MKYILTVIAIIFYSSLYAQNVNLTWAKSVGGAESSSLAIDASGNTYTVGVFQGTVDFDPGAGTYYLTSAGGGDIFISKLDVSGNFIWAKALGGPADEADNQFISVDAADNVYTTGKFQGTADFDPGPGIYNLSAAGGNDIFVSKLNAAGNFVWAKRIGAAYNDFGTSVKPDASGNVYILGGYTGTVDFDPGTGTSNLSSVGGHDFFVCKLNASGNFVWAKSMGGSSDEIGMSMALDVSGNIYVTGYFSGIVDMDPGTGINNLVSAGANDIFIDKFDTSGSLLWAKRIGSTDYDGGYSITIDVFGNILTTGYFNGTVDFDPGTGKKELFTLSSTDMFVVKLDASGNFVWAKNMGAYKAFISCTSVATDLSGNVYTTGYFNGKIDFDPGLDAFYMTNQNNYNYPDVFISKLDASGNFAWAESIGSTNGEDEGRSIAVGASGHVFTTGGFQGPVDFDPGTGTFNLTDSGTFILKWSQPPTAVPILSATSAPALHIYPNPIKEGKLSFEMNMQKGSYILSLTNSRGQQMYTTTISHSGGPAIQQFQLPEALSAGIYYLSLRGGGVAITRKLVID